MLKPVIKLWCLPANRSQSFYERIYKAVVRAVIASAVGPKTKDDLIILMPSDHMKMGLGEEIVIEIDFVDWTIHHSHLLNAVYRTIVKKFPNVDVRGKLTYADPDGKLLITHMP
jgi:hypothetical protein